MRLREIQLVLIQNLPIIEYTGGHVQSTNPPQYRITDVLKINEAIQNISNIGLFQDVIGQLRLTSFYNNPNDPITVNQQEHHAISTLINKIKSTGELFLEVLTETLHSEGLSDRTVSVKIDKADGFSGLIETCEKLKRVIELPLGEYREGGEVKIINFDSGSFWFDLLLPTTASVTLIGSIAWAGAVIFKRDQEAFGFKQYAYGLEMGNEYLEKLTEAAKAKIDSYIESEAQLIQNEFFKGGDNDQLGRLKLSIREYSELIKKGVEIHPSLNASEKVNELFPSYTNLNLIESKIKYLPESTNSQESESN